MTWEEGSLKEAGEFEENKGLLEKLHSTKHLEILHSISVTLYDVVNRILDWNSRSPGSYPHSSMETLKAQLLLL